jgi:hypothetical protein
MGWKDSHPVHQDMSSAQRMMILRLRERFDRVTPGSYSSDVLPPWSKHDAIREINKLQDKIANRDAKKTQVYAGKCPFCSSLVRPCCSLMNSPVTRPL